MNNLDILIAGAAGEGIQSIGDILADIVSQKGYAVFAWQEYESRIRGGHNSYRLRITPKPLNAPLFEADILVSLNQDSENKYRRYLKPDGILLSQPTEKKAARKSIHIPFVRIAKEISGNKIFANTVAAGALAAMIGIDLAALNVVIRQRLGAKGQDILQTNFKAALAGYQAAERQCKDICPWKLPDRDEHFFKLTGNEAIALGAAYAGCRFLSAYPMTPSTEIMAFLERREQQLGVFVEQAEDEIAAVNMAIGAGFAGARAMTATSGGGFALMVEGISLAGMTETPVVIVLGQRPGPATGLPTRTAQGDLLFAINAGHGEFPRLVFAPCDAQDAFYKTVRAFNLAEEFQIPVIILTDQLLAESRFSIKDIDLDRFTPISHRVDPETIDSYKRYALQEDGISPRLFPGQSRHLVAADSDEHDEYGHITEDLQHTAPAMLTKRLDKYQSIRTRIQSPEQIGVPDADMVFVGWGSTRNAILDAVDSAASLGINTGMIHFSELWPLPKYDFPSSKRFFAVENNATGQLSSLLKMQYDFQPAEQILRYDGLPVSGPFIMEAIRKWI